jgi:hypothetical protein
MVSRKADDQFTDEETTRRRDAVIKHMLNTPPKRHSEMKIGKREAKASKDTNPPKKRGRPKKEKSI